MVAFYKGRGVFFEHYEEENSKFISFYQQESMVAFRDDNGTLSQWIPINEGRR